MQQTMLADHMEFIHAWTSEFNSRQKELAARIETLEVKAEGLATKKDLLTIRESMNRMASLDDVNDIKTSLDTIMVRLDRNENNNLGDSFPTIVEAKQVNQVSSIHLQLLQHQLTQTRAVLECGSRRDQ